MRVAVLSRKASLYSTRRLLEATRERGHEATSIDYLRCSMNITGGKPSVLIAGEPLEFDAIIPRIGASYTFYGNAVVRQFEMMGTVSANRSQAIARARDKMRSLQLLSNSDIGLPTTGFAHDVRDIDSLLKAIGSPPYIIKLLEGTQGMGVVLAETRKAAQSVIGAFRQLDANILVQRFVSEAQGTDIRAFVVGGEVIASMQRTAAEGEFRANLHQGGHAEAIELSAEEQRTARRAAEVLQLGVAGVDLLRAEEGPVVIEVNASPGLEGIERASGVDVAGKIVEYLERLRG